MCCDHPKGPLYRCPEKTKRSGGGLLKSAVAMRKDCRVREDGSSRSTFAHHLRCECPAALRSSWRASCVPPTAQPSANLYILLTIVRPLKTPARHHLGCSAQVAGVEAGHWTLWIMKIRPSACGNAFTSLLHGSF